LFEVYSLTLAVYSAGASRYTRCRSRVYFVRYVWLILFVLIGSLCSLVWLISFALFGSFRSLFAESANDLRGDLDFGDEVFGG